MNIEKFHEIIQERIRISIETQDNWDYGIEKCREKVIEILSEDIEGSATYIETECTADELSWISEIWDTVAEKTQSIKFIRSLETAIKKYPEEDKKYHLRENIKFAYGAIDEDFEMEF
ncbi:MAG: hypothetical protein HUK21_01530 [Fibrobacteraceae bacterium]|nr:hypothetical protein [Fibrobacteraceae bacterium]